ncbi:MAG: tetratricopeptide repeat protein [Patescibacteria group bacterium]
MPEASKSLRIQIIADSVARWAVFLFLGVLPFFLIPNAWVTVPQAKMLLVIIVIVTVSIAWIVARFAEGSMRIPKSFLLGAGALLPIAYLVSALSSGRGWNSFVGTGVEQDTVIAILAIYALLLLFSLVLSQGAREIGISLRALFIGSAVLLITQALHVAFPGYVDFGGALPNSVSSAIGSWHDLAIFLGLVLLLSISYKGPSDESPKLRLVRIFSGLISLVFLVIINSYDVWLGLTGIGFIYGAYLWFELRKSGNVPYKSAFRAILPYIILVVLALGLSYGGAKVVSYLPARLQLSQVEVRPSWQGTLAVGKQAFNSTREFITGSGPNSFTRTWNLYKPVSVNATQFWNTDFFSGIGLIPTSLLSVGILGLLSWGLLILCILWRAVRFSRDRSFRTPAKTATGAVIAGVLYLFVFNVVYVPGVALFALSFALLGILIALFVVQGKIGVWTFSLNWREPKSASVSAATIVLGAIVVFGAIESLRAIVSDTQVNRAIIVYSETSDLDTASRYNDYALSVLGNNDRAHRTAVEIGLLQLKKLLAEGEVTDDLRSRLQEALQTTLKHGISAVSADGNSYRNWLTLAQLYNELSLGGIEGANRNARDAYGRAQIESPTSPLPLLGLVQLDLAASDSKSALLHLNAALAIKSDFAVARLLLSQLSARTNDLAKAEEEALNVVRLAPEDPLAWYNLGLVLYTRKSYDNAAVALERAVQLEKDYANALFTLGLTYYQLGRPKDAISAFDKVSALNPDDPALKKVIANVKAGKDPLNDQTAK